ncbi:MAG: helix-turn-helix transcriptional regulator [Phreatobacter sp.]|nr:helix-turn-helix transcriptional regulator [Phreatobacter sp.]
MSISPSQCRAARGLVDMDQAALAKAANVSRNTIVDFEKARRTPNPNNLLAIQSALEAAGVEFTNGGQPGVRTKAGVSGQVGDTGEPVEADRTIRTVVAVHDMPPTKPVKVVVRKVRTED